jgi:opacity protein-like surface antigen
MKKMRKLLLTTAAIAALSAPAMAADLASPVPPSGSPIYSSAPMVSGDISGALGGAWFSFPGESESFGSYDASARFALPIFGGAGFEGELLDGGLFNGDFSSNTFLGLAHLYAQTPNFAVGVFGGAGSSQPVTLWQGGLEGQAYLGNFTAEGTVAYITASAFDEDISLWNARFGGKYYFTPDDKLSLFGNFVSINESGAPDIWGIDGSLEHRFSGTPWSAFVKAAWYRESEGGEHADLTTALVGVRVSLDGQGSTLQSHDRAVPWQSNLGIFGTSFGGPVVVAVP